MYRIEYRYTGQETCRSYHTCATLDGVIDWVKRFQDKTLEGYINCGEVDLIRITLSESPIVTWIQIRREIHNCQSCGQVDRKADTFEVDLILNDYPIGKLDSLEHVGSFLKNFVGSRCDSEAKQTLMCTCPYLGGASRDPDPESDCEIHGKGSHHV